MIIILIRSIVLMLLTSSLSIVLISSTLTNEVQDSKRDMTEISTI